MCPILGRQIVWLAGELATEEEEEEQELYSHYSLARKQQCKEVCPILGRQIVCLAGEAMEEEEEEEEEEE